VGRNFFMVYSGDALYKLLRTERNKPVRLYPDPDKDKHSEKENLPYWQGTVVGVDISLEQGTDFTTLLSLIRKAYLEGVKERKKLEYKKARFV